MSKGRLGLRRGEEDRVEVYDRLQVVVGWQGRLLARFAFVGSDPRGIAEAESKYG
jgi:hypothetical protein